MVIFTKSFSKMSYNNTSNSGLTTSEEFSASRPASVPQATNGKGSNLDNSAVQSGPVITDSSESLAHDYKLSTPLTRDTLVSACSSGEAKPSSSFSLILRLFLLFASSSFVNAFCHAFCTLSLFFPSPHFFSRSLLVRGRFNSRSAFSFPSSENYRLLAQTTTCIPLLLVAYGYITPLQAQNLNYVIRFSDLPKPIRDGILRSRRAALLVRVFDKHVEGLNAPVSNGDFTLRSLSTLLFSTSVYLSTPFTDAEPKPTAELATPAIPALGGVRGVPTQLSTSSKSSNLDQRWHPRHYPRQQIDQVVAFSLQGDNLFTKRESSFRRHLPTEVANPRLPHVFTAELKSLVGSRVTTSSPATSYAVPTSYTRSWASQPITDRQLKPDKAALSQVLFGADYSKTSFSAAEQAISVNRFFDTRGAKIIPRWEGDQWNRWSGITSLFGVGQANRNYFSIAYRLLARYYFASVAHSREEFTPGVQREDTDVLLTGISTELPVLVPPVPGQPPQVIPNPEAALFTQAAYEGLARGTKQFVDAEGLSHSELQELLAAIVPQEADHLPLLAMPGGYQGPLEIKASRVPNALEWYFLGPTRYTHPNKVDEVFIHFGNNPVPDLAALGAHVFKVPSRSDILSVLRYLAVRHGAGPEIELAIEALLTRIVMYRADAGPLGTKASASNHTFINADGHYELHLPRAATASAYFDCFFTPEPLPPSIAEFASFDTNMLVNTGVLVAQARATSLNWAATAYSMVGRQWEHVGGNETNQYVRNHIDVWLRKYAHDILNLWTSQHNNAMALQFGWCISPEVRCTEANVVVPWWKEFQAPYLANPYLELWQANMLPSHQLLPYYDPTTPATPSWPSNSPRPVTDSVSFKSNPHAAIARDFPPEVGRTWMTDGGVLANAQFYASTGVAGGFRYEGHANDAFKLVRWRNRLTSQFPQATADQNPVWMGDINTPFADYLLPGSLPTVNLSTNTAFSHGVALKDKVSRADKNHIGRLWYDSVRQVPHACATIEYISPFPDRREYDSLQDYSIVVWEKDNVFSGMSLIPVDFSPVDLGKFQPPAGLTLPGFTPPSAVDTSDVVHNPRVARSTRQPRAKANNVLQTVKAFQAAAHQQQQTRDDDHGITGTIQHTSKYPVEYSQIPRDLESYTPMVREGHVSIAPADCSQASLAALKRELEDSKLRHEQLQTKLEAATAACSFDQNEMLEARARIARANAEREARLAAQRSLPPRSPKHRPQSRSTPPGNPTVRHDSQNTPAAPRLPDPNAHTGQPILARLDEGFVNQPPVVPNDDVAYQTQRRVPVYGVPKAVKDPFRQLHEDYLRDFGPQPDSKTASKVHPPSTSEHPGPSAAPLSEPLNFGPVHNPDLNAEPADGWATADLGKN
jgi:hypothetical protein